MLMILFVQTTCKAERTNRYLYRKSQDGCIKFGQASDVNSAGTTFSALSNIDNAAILTGISISEAGSSGRVCGAFLVEEILLEEEQANRKISANEMAGYFKESVFILKTNIISHPLC